MQNVEGQWRKTAGKNRDRELRSKNAEPHGGRPANVAHASKHHPNDRNEGGKANRRKHRDVNRPDGGAFCLHGDRLGDDAGGMLLGGFRSIVHPIIRDSQFLDKGPLSTGYIVAVSRIDLLLNTFFCPDQKMLDRVLGKIKSDQKHKKENVEYLAAIT
ncbi:MAG: hypothetical protein E5V78_16730 [Mesorhizobium sp.]|nr:MAG: hypothetical protein E5V78_16730 [Mesorhizobium sp.]